MPASTRQEMPDVSFAGSNLSYDNIAESKELSKKSTSFFPAPTLKTCPRAEMSNLPSSMIGCDVLTLRASQ